MFGKIFKRFFKSQIQIADDDLIQIQRFYNREIMIDREISRHPSGIGSVVRSNVFGASEILVLDAKYRAIKPWCAKIEGIPSGFCYIGESQLPRSMCDSRLRAKFPSLHRDGSATQKTNALVKFGNMEAAKWCRGQFPNASLPNLLQCIIMYLEADRLNFLDPTAGDCFDLILGQDIWSSTQAKEDLICCVTSDGVICGKNCKNMQCVAPVIELR